MHSLKDLPTDLPAGLKLGAVSRRADVRDVFIYRDAEWTASPVDATQSESAAGGSVGRRFSRKMAISQMPDGMVIGTSSTRRKAQLLASRPDFSVVDIRGNVATRLKKLADQPELDAIVLAAAGLDRLGFKISPSGVLSGDSVPAGLVATILDIDEMLPCVGQGALGIEIREHDEHLQSICDRLNDDHTHRCVSAERALLKAMGGGCQSPVGAFAEVSGAGIRLRAISFQHGPLRRAELSGALNNPVALGQSVAAELQT